MLSIFQNVEKMFEVANIRERYQIVNLILLNF